MTLSTFRHFCSSARVLDVYESRTVSLFKVKSLCESLRKAVSLSLRAQDVSTPDHQHRFHQENTFANCHSLADMLLTALGVKDAKHVHGLEIRHGALYVCPEYMEQWQQEVTAYQSPVPVMAAAWLACCLNEGIEQQKAITALSESLRNSALPSIHDPRLHRLIHDETNNSGRLCDLHVHINGSTEFTSVWLHSLRHVDKTVNFIDIAANSKGRAERVDLFFQQLRVDLKRIKSRLNMAANLRYWLCLLLRTTTEISHVEQIPRIAEVQALLREGIYNGATIHKHPFTLYALLEHANELQVEGVMWFYALKALHETKDHTLAVLIHTYLLVMHQHLRLLVQQPEQFGFDQFQYITQSGAREAVEDARKRGFTERFRQYQGMYGPDMTYVEVRFSPKNSAKENSTFLNSIWNSYLDSTDQRRVRTKPCSACPRLAEMFYIRGEQLHPEKPSNAAKRPKPFSLGLVAHFIKDKDEEGSFRHAKLREKLRKQAQALIDVKNELQLSQPDLAAALVGKDAASNELDTPPEVFAPIFRQLNRAGISHTTYHVGEDFEHILCGIRAVHEAITFLNMGSGDRLGHATALGLNPKLCRKKVHYCRKGQWLDTLIWMTRILEETPQLRDFAGEGFKAQANITTLYREIYQCAPPDLPVLWKAWELRQFERKTFDNIQVVVCANSKAEQKALHRMKQKAGEDLFNSAWAELDKYHKMESRKRWDEVVTLCDEQQPHSEFIKTLQDCIIRELCRKNIAVEVLPTSNVRISHYNATDEHHVMRWLCSDDPRPAPQVVLGTDDPGIFSTTLRNEYAFILKKLQHLHPGNIEKPYGIIKHLIENGMSYRFN